MARKLALVLAALALLIAGVWLALARRDDARSAARDAASAAEAERVRAQPDAPADSPTDQTEAAAQRAAVAESDARPSEPPAVVVFGRVVDQRRSPAPGATISLALDSLEVARAVTNERGEYELPLATRPPIDTSAILVATRGEREAGHGRVRVRGESAPSSLPPRYARPEGGSRIAADVVALTPASPLEVEVSWNGAPVSDAEVRAVIDFPLVTLGSVRADARGVALLPNVPDGPATIRATTAALSGETLAYPPEESRVSIALAERFDLLVQVLDRDTAEPIADARLALRTFRSLPSGADAVVRGTSGDLNTVERIGDEQRTDADGLASFPGMDRAGRYGLDVRAAGYVAYPGKGSEGGKVRVEEQPTIVRLSRQPARTVRWPIVAGEVPAPAEGAELRLRPAPGSQGFRLDSLIDLGAPDRGVVRAGNVEIAGLQGGAGFLVEAPDGALAQVWIGELEETGKPVSFRRPRTIEVSVRSADGAPSAGIGVQARNQGNNALSDTVETDASGVARLEGLYGSLANVYVRPRLGRREVLAGAVDLEKGDGRIEHVLAGEARVRVQVTIEGRPMLPPRFWFVAESGMSISTVLEELPERGEVVLALDQRAGSGPTKLGLQAPGFLPASFTFEAPKDGSEAWATIALTRGLTMLVYVRKPEKEGFAVKVEAWKEASGAWGDVFHYFTGLRLPNAAHGAFRFYDLAPGRYRAVDETSGASSEAVELVAGAPEPSVELDLSGIEWVTGLVEVPDPAELPRARVLVEAEGARALSAADPSEPLVPAKDGTFRVRVRRGQTSVLRAWHPWLSSANSVALDAGREGVVLKLAAGDELRIPAPQLADTERRGTRRILLYAGSAEGAASHKLSAPLVGGVLRCGGVPPGRWTLWIDPGGGLAPLVLSDVELKPGVNQLAEVRFARGTTVRLRLHAPEGSSPPRVSVQAQRLGEPSYSRFASSNGEAVVELPGLGPGRFALRHGAEMMGGRSAETTIDCDGVHDIEIDVE